jgi:hypothetical protein
MDALFATANALFVLANGGFGLLDGAVNLVSCFMIPRMLLKTIRYFSFPEIWERPFPF